MVHANPGTHFLVLAPISLLLVYSTFHVAEDALPSHITHRRKHRRSSSQGTFLISGTGVATNILQAQCLFGRGLSPRSLAWSWSTRSLFVAVSCVA